MSLEALGYMQPAAKVTQACVLNGCEPVRDSVKGWTTFCALRTQTIDEEWAAAFLAAEGLHNYLRERDSAEGVGYALSVDFFANAFIAGCRYFFGIAVCDCGHLLWDEQEPAPGLLARWTIQGHMSPDLADAFGRLPSSSRTEIARELGRVFAEKAHDPAGD